MISTPASPTATALQRSSRTFSLRNSAANATEISGIAKLMAVASASGSSARPVNMKNIAKMPVRPRKKWPSGCCVRRAVVNSPS